MTRQQDFHERARRDHYSALQARRAQAKAAKTDADDSWTLPVALFGAMAVALMLSALV